MTGLHEPFISRSFLRTAWAREYEAFRQSPAEDELLKRLENWAGRTDLKETSAEQAFVQQFFHETWGYYGTGQTDAEGFTSYPRYSVPGAGQRGGVGEADLALGWFERPGVAAVPQVLCEFKDIRSSLDAPQNRKGNRRSPVKQCLDYLFNARRGLFGNEAIIPSWGIATDMNEFRLYWFDRAPQQYLRFVITPVCQQGQGENEASLQYGGMEVSQARKLKVLEEENRKLKKLLAEQMLDNSTLKEMLGKNF